MKMPEIEQITKTHTVQLLKCYNCDYEWEPRIAQPKQCPNCKVRLVKFWKNQETK